MFRELMRKDHKLSEEDVLRLLKKETRGVLSILGEDGYPYGMPMNHWYHEEDGMIYFHCGKKGHRVDALKKCAKVSFCVYDQGVRKDGNWFYTVNSVIVFGKIEIIEDLDEIVRITTKLCEKFDRSEAEIAAEMASSAKNTLLLKLIPEQICGKWVNEA